jgi:hypothetical protein
MAPNLSIATLDLFENTETNIAVHDHGLLVGTSLDFRPNIKPVARFGFSRGAGVALND